MSSGEPQPRLRIIGPGRAGLSFARALAAAGWTVTGVLGRHDDLTAAAEEVDLLLVATPDGSIAGVAAAVAPVAGTVVAHLAGSLGTGVLAPHPRRAAIHPLLPLPDPVTGAARLPGAWFAVAGDPMAARVVAALGGRSLPVADADRAAYHAAATLASNHLVALLGQVERVAAGAGVPLAAYLDLAGAALADVAARGPAAALTGPVARGDWETVDRHLAAIAPEDRPGYRAMAERAARLAGVAFPPARRPPTAEPARPHRRSRPSPPAEPALPHRRSRPCPHRRSPPWPAGDDRHRAARAGGLRQGPGRRARRRPHDRAGPDHGIPPRRPHRPHGQGRRRMRRGGRHDLRQPAAVRRRPRTWPATPGTPTATWPGPRRPAWRTCSPRASGRCSPIRPSPP